MICTAVVAAEDRLLSCGGESHRGANARGKKEVQKDPKSLELSRRKG